MARIRPAKGQTESGPSGARRPPGPKSPRPTPSRGRVDKAGTVTKGVQSGRLTKFVGETMSEMRKVAWPNRNQLAQATGVVLLFVAIVTVYLAGLDAVFSRLVDALF
jgi:preprotein translocase subunit SecE